MSDPVTTSRSARESLARGLAALQVDPSTPPAILEIAEPIALAMGSLHKIESSAGAALVPNAETALGHVRAALSQLQAQTSGHPSVPNAMEAVAASLGLVHQLSKMVTGPSVAPAAPAPVAAVAPAPVAAVAPAPVAAVAPAPVAAVAPAPVAPAPAPAPVAAVPRLGTQPLAPAMAPRPAAAAQAPMAPMAPIAPMAPQPMAQQPAPQQQAPQAFAPQPMAQQPAPPQAFAPQPVPVAAPQQQAFAPPQQPAPQFAAPPQQPAPQFAAPPQQPAPQFAAPPQQQPTLAQTVALGQPQGLQHTLPVTPQAAPDPFAAPRGSAPPAPAPAPAGAPGRPVPVLNADLGAHSPTNFYKGLSGNDVVDHGGLFVATYMIPKIGSPVRLHVSLPGGYEFDAEAIVRWARDQAGSSESALPGFGAQFTNITPEARQLIYRYVRNREPLFHDDL